MREFHWNGQREPSRPGCDHPGPWERLQRFSAQNLRAITYDKKTKLLPGCQIHARSRSVKGFTLARTQATDGRSRVVRSAAEIADDGRDQFALLLLLRGEAHVLQFGRSLRLALDSFALTASSEPIVQESGHGLSDSIYFAIPRQFVNQRVIVGEDICVRPPRTGLDKLVLDTVTVFQKNAWDLSDDDFQKSARVVAELVLLALGGPADQLSGEGSVRAAHLARAKHIIRKRLAEPDLTLSVIAAESGLSLRYLHNLFRDEGRTMYEYLKGERLQRARGMIDVSSANRMTITEIAMECGFSDPAYFSRLFKQVFGMTPSEVKQPCT